MKMLNDVIKQIQDVKKNKFESNIVNESELYEKAELNYKCCSKRQNDIGLAERFQLRNKKKLCYWNGDWFYYTGDFWSKREDATYKLLKQTICMVETVEAELIENDASREAFEKWARKLGSAATMEGVIRLARREMARIKTFEVSDYLINFKNGTVDLRDGSLRPHNPDDDFLYVLPYDYDPLAKSEAWEQYLSTVFIGQDAELMPAYIQRLIGATLISGRDFEKCVWLVGGGSNGKTTFCETIYQALGPLARTINNDLFLAKKWGGQSHPTEIARLHQAKYATCNDISLSAKLDEATFKRLVSTSTQMGRFMNRDFFEFRPTHKFWISVNNMPQVRDDSDGMWRRHIVIPFLKKFEGSKDIDLTLKARIEAQLPGVWAWMVQGAILYNSEGLLPEPSIVSEAILEWRNNEDWWVTFANEECVIAPNKKVKLERFHAHYQYWAKQNGMPTLNLSAFGKRITLAGFLITKSKSAPSVLGIKLKEDVEDDGNDEL